MKLLERFNAPTPTFFKKLRNVGLILGSIAGAIVAAPIALPAGVISAAGYLALAAGVASAISQATILVEPEGEKHLIQEVNQKLPLDLQLPPNFPQNTTPGKVVSDSIQTTRKKGFKVLKALKNLLD